jgi:hypothetical protein
VRTDWATRRERGAATLNRSGLQSVQAGYRRENQMPEIA